jgi:hypothetical protein
VSPRATGSPPGPNTSRATTVTVSEVGVRVLPDVSQARRPLGRPVQGLASPRGAETGVGQHGQELAQRGGVATHASVVVEGDPSAGPRCEIEGASHAPQRNRPVSHEFGVRDMRDDGGVAVMLADIR